MRGAAARGWVGFLLVAAATGVPCEAVAAQRVAVLPDASQAEIDGEIAVGVWPTEGGVVVGPDGFTVHFADDSNLEQELVYPAGYWFKPPDGRYKVWIEGRLETARGVTVSRIAPSFTVLRYRREPFQGRGLAANVEVGPAGSVGLDRRYRLTESQSLRLLHLTATTPAGKRSRGFLRALTAQRSDEQVLVPAGEVVGLVYDLVAKRYIAVSRPTRVPADGDALVLPAAERGVSDLLVILRRKDKAEDAGQDEVTLELVGAEDLRRPADVVVPTWEWIYGLWYDVPGRAVHLEARSQSEFLSREVVLEPGGVATFRGELQPMPYLDVRLELPAELSGNEAVLEVTLANDHRVVARRPLHPAGAPVRIEGLPPAELAVSVILASKPPWKLRERVDLSDGLPQEVVFRPTPIVLSGTIYYGDEPATGDLTIYTINELGVDLSQVALKADVNDEGEYEVVVFHPGRFPMSLDLPQVPGPAFPVRPVPHVTQSMVYDIRVPRSGARVRVRDAATQAPIEGALVIAHNDFAIASEDESPRRSAAAHRSTTGEDGWADLPALQPGDLKVGARKDGYLEVREPLVAKVKEGEVTELMIDLQPVGKTTPLQVVLPDGRAAAGAQFRAQRSSWDEVASWQGRADRVGRVDIPERVVGTWLLVRHPEAGSWIQRWEPAGEETVVIAMPPAAGDLTFRLVGHDGEIVSYAAVALRFDDIWVAGAPLAWLTGSVVAASGQDGLWTARHLPAKPIKVIAGDPATVRLALQGSLDALALPIAPPWPPGPLEVTADRTR